jgi:tRNA pseudouridine38-40 synthase
VEGIVRQGGFDGSASPEAGAPDAGPLGALQRRTLALEMAYDGSAFSGFAWQPGRLTVQGSLNEALELLYKRPVETVCAGRTDAGVHALRQVVSFDVSEEELASRSLAVLKRSLNALIDDHASISVIQEMQPGFSARFDAKAREYRYYLYRGDTRPVLIDGRVWRLGWPLDLDAMREGARYLIGEHDFKSFCLSASAEGKPTHRKVIELTVEEQELLGSPVVVVRVLGSAFLHSMVRTIVGTLVAVGLGKHPSSWVGEVLQACNRGAAGETAPAKGLILWHVYY